MVLSRSISESRRHVCRIGEGTGRWRSGSGRTLCGLGRINLRATCGISLLIIWRRGGSIAWHTGRAFFSTFSAGAGLPSGDGICRIRGVCGSSRTSGHVDLPPRGACLHDLQRSRRLVVFFSIPSSYKRQLAYLCCAKPCRMNYGIYRISG